MEYETRNRIDEPILKIYLYGSKVYGNYTTASDWDYIIVVKSEEDLYYRVDNELVNRTIYSEPLFIKHIINHKVDVLECIFQSKSDPYLKYFELDKDKLRRAFSSVASNSYVKCKKKISQGDYHTGKKSLWHSLRILDFGIQIAKHNRITDYSSMNGIYSDVMKSTNWKELNSKYKPTYNILKSELRLVAPLDSEEKS